MIVLDANILIRAVLGRRVRQLIDTYAGQGVRFFAPDAAFDDAEKYLPPLLEKRGKPHADFSASPEYLRNIIEQDGAKTVRNQLKKENLVPRAITLLRIEGIEPEGLISVTAEFREEVLSSANEILPQFLY
jgi:hypothetical protein